MKYLITLLMCTVVGLTAASAQCVVFDQDEWFSATRHYTLVRFSQDGLKLAVKTSNDGWLTPASNSASTVHLRVLDISSSPFTILSDWEHNNNRLEQGGGMVWTDNGNLVYVDMDGRFFVETGASGNPPAAGWTITAADLEAIPGTNLVVLSGNLGGSNFTTRLVDATTSPATATVLNSVQSQVFGYNGRIYYTEKAPDDIITYDGNPNWPTDGGSIIKCMDYTGNPCSDWVGDITVPGGAVVDIRVRETDDLVFARIHSDYINKSSHAGTMALNGVVVFDTIGQLQQGFNNADLKMVLSTAGSRESRIDFDSLGSIYTNSQNTRSPEIDHNVGFPTGLIKFDSNGNYDQSFTRNFYRTSLHVSESAGSFHVNPLTQEIVYSLSAASHWNAHYATDNTNEVGMVEPKADFISNYFTGDFSIGNHLANGSRYYRGVRFRMNNGSLKIPGDANQAVALCGVSTPETIPQPPTPAAGTINCPETTIVEMPEQGTASNFVMNVEINVTSTGVFAPITVSGSGFSLQDSDFVFNSTSTGVQTFGIPMKYDGTATLGAFTVDVTGAGSCMGDLTDNTHQTPVDAEIKIWTSDKCSLKIVGPKLK